MIPKTHYDVLKVSQDAPEEVIRMAYKALVKKYHPDTYKGADATEKTKEINTSYEVLIDPTKKHQYDEWLKNNRKENEPPPPAQNRPIPKKSLTQKISRVIFWIYVVLTCLFTTGFLIIPYIIFYGLKLDRFVHKHKKTFCLGPWLLLFLALLPITKGTDNKIKNDTTSYEEGKKLGLEPINQIEPSKPIKKIPNDNEILEEDKEPPVKMSMGEFLEEGGKLNPEEENRTTTFPQNTPFREKRPILDEQYQPPVLDATGSNEKYNEPPESQPTYKEIHNLSLQKFFNNYLKVIASNNGLALNSYLGPTLTYTYSKDPSGRASKQAVITDHLNIIQKYPDRKYMNKKILSITPIFPAGTAITPEMRKYPPGVIIKYKFDYWYKGKEVKTGTATVDLTVEDTRFWVNYLPKGTNPYLIWTPEEIELLNTGTSIPVWKITGYSEVVDRKL